MNKLTREDVKQYVENNIGNFHQRRLTKLSKLRLSSILHRKNPYLFRAKNILTAQDLVKNLLDAHLSSQEEAIFGEFLEGLAIFVCGKVFGGWKSSTEGIDLEFISTNIHHLVSIKSGPNWGNSSQIKKMIDNFKKAQRTLRTSGSNIQIRSINGCCYGQENRPDKGDYFKLCGQDFWELISGDPELYVEIIEPLGHQAKQHNEEFIIAYPKIINGFSYQFINEFCDNGAIDWERLVKFNSARKTQVSPI